MTESNVLTSMASKTKQKEKEVTEAKETLKKKKKAAANNDDDENRLERVRDRPEVSGSAEKVTRVRKPDKYGFIFGLDELKQGLEAILSRENLTQAEIDKFRREQKEYEKWRRQNEEAQSRVEEIDLPADEKEEKSLHHSKQLKIDAQER